MLLYLLRILVRWERRVVTLFDLLAERQEVHLVSIKWALQSCHLKEEEDSFD